MYPQIVPTEIYENVRRKTETNKYGTRSVEVVYLLRNKIKCGYCGSPISAECGTAKNGQKIRYYKCLGRKHQSGCKKSQVRKEILEKYVLDNVCEQMQRPEILDKMATYLLQVQENRIRLGSDKSHKRETSNREYNQQHYASHRIRRTKRNGYETYERTRRKTDRHRKAIDD